MTMGGMITMDKGHHEPSLTQLVMVPTGLVVFFLFVTLFPPRSWTVLWTMICLCYVSLSFFYYLM